ncbi:hypothetical protein ACFQY3_06935 [Paenibacillus farraposensis]|uniref:hypothetical protein n=1 Tax=Paenibacillus farraposensis TaxID=2807095 RepID=UPI0036141DCF
MSAVLGAAVLSLLSAFLVINPPNNGTIAIVTTVKLLGGLFTYFMMSHIKKQNGPFTCSKRLRIATI